jgi:hypothetical protein
LLTKGKVDGAAVVSEQSKFYIRDMVWNGTVLLFKGQNAYITVLKADCIGKPVEPGHLIIVLVCRWFTSYNPFKFALLLNHTSQSCIL